ncbi:hypothetical protein, partial [uncultured Alistipes sp.]
FYIKYYKNNSLHYFSKELCKHLKDNKITDEVSAQVRKIPADVWRYIHATSNGKIWDDFVEMFPQYTRDEIKRMMFAKVFYSYSKNVTQANELGNAFKTLYPTVTKVIRDLKRKFHTECIEEDRIKMKRIKTPNGNSKIVERDAFQLPHLLMRLESAIFTEILTRLFRKRYLHCIGIHDAVAVMNDKYSPDYIEKIMMEVYKAYGLHPKLDTTTYKNSLIEIIN